MHYGSNDFAKDEKNPTIAAKNGNKVEPSVQFTAVHKIYQKTIKNIVSNDPSNDLNNRMIFWI